MKQAVPCCECAYAAHLPFTTHLGRRLLPALWKRESFYCLVFPRFEGYLHSSSNNTIPIYGTAKQLRITVRTTLDLLRFYKAQLSRLRKNTCQVSQEDRINKGLITKRPDGFVIRIPFPGCILSTYVFKAVFELHAALTMLSMPESLTTYFYSK